MIHGACEGKLPSRPGPPQNTGARHPATAHRPKSPAVYVPHRKSKNRLVKTSRFLLGGDDRDRTDYLLNAIQALSQVSYAPVCFVRSLERFISIAQPGGNCKRFFQKNQVFLKKGKTHRNIPENGTNMHNKPSAGSACRRKSPGGVHRIFTTKISVHAIIFLGITPGQSAAAAKETTR